MTCKAPLHMNSVTSRAGKGTTPPRTPVAAIPAPSACAKRSNLDLRTGETPAPPTEPSSVRRTDQLLRRDTHVSTGQRTRRTSMLAIIVLAAGCSAPSSTNEAGRQAKPSIIQGESQNALAAPAASYTEFSRSVLNADGTIATELYAAPRFTRTGGLWREIDTTLRVAPSGLCLRDCCWRCVLRRHNGAGG